MIRISSNKVSLDPMKRKYKNVTRGLPRKLGAAAVEHFHENFRKQGFVDKNLEKWKERKKADKNPRTRFILVKSGRLRRDIRVRRVTQTYALVGTSLPYARIHNEGGTIRHPGGTAYAFGKNGTVIWVSNKKVNSWKKKKPIGRTKPHRIKIPQRKFMGRSYQLTQTLKRITTNKLKKIS